MSQVFVTPRTSPTSPSHDEQIPAPISPSLSQAVTQSATTIAMMKHSLEDLGRTIDALSTHTTEIVEKGHDSEASQQINSLHDQMIAQDLHQEVQIEEIKALLQEVLENDVVEHLRALVAQGVLEEIDEIAREQVEALLPTYISEDLQQQVAFHRKQLEEVQRALHNSESRRANARLKSTKLDSALHTIYKADGTISSSYPKTLGGLFDLSNDAAKQLLEEYDLVHDASAPRERNVNRFMQFVGVAYQLVRSRPSS